MTPQQISDTLASHARWLADPTTGERANLRRADLSDADLRGADLPGAYLTGATLTGADLLGAYLPGATLTGATLMGAYLTGADLTGAYLTGADLRDVNLSCSSGVLWAQVGPIGTDRRTVTGVWQDDRVALHAGCFHGSRSEWDHIIARSVDDPDSSPWEWPDDPTELARLAAECTAAADYVQASIHAQLAALEARP